LQLHTLCDLLIATDQTGPLLIFPSKLETMFTLAFLSYLRLLDEAVTQEFTVMIIFNMNSSVWSTISVKVYLEKHTKIKNIALGWSLCLKAPTHFVTTLENTFSQKCHQSLKTNYI